MHQSGSFDLCRFTFGCVSQLFERLAQHRQQMMNPEIGLALAQAKVQTMHTLQGVSFEINQHKQQFVTGCSKASFAASADTALTVLSFFGLLPPDTTNCRCG